MNQLCNGKSMESTVTIPQKVPTTSGHTTTSSNMNWLIYTLYARQEYEFCQEVIKQQLEINYDKEYLYFIKGLIARHKKDYMESLKYLQKTIDLNPKNPDNFKEIGKTLFLLGRWKQSLEVFLKAELLLQRPDQEIYYYIGELFYRNIGKPQAGLAEAKEYFQRAVHNGKQIESYQKLAKIYQDENNFPKAIEILENSLQINSENVDVLSEIGILYLKVNDTKSAFDKLFDVTRLNGDCSKALIALGTILQSRNDVDGALNKYKLVDKQSLELSEIWSNIALCFAKKKKLIAAISCLKKSIWISPLNFNCLYNLGYVNIIAHQFASAYQALACAINLRPDSAECYMLLGITLKNLNDLENGFLAMEKSTMLPDAIKNPLIYLNFAIFCWEINKLDQAIGALENFDKIVQQVKVKNEYIKIATNLRRNLLQLKELSASAAAEAETVAPTEASHDFDNDEVVTKQFSEEKEFSEDEV